MAAFNPPTSQSPPPDFSRSSQGIKADTSVGDAIGEIGSLFGDLAKGGYRAIKEGLRETATEAVDGIQNFFIGAGQKRPEDAKPAAEPVPPEIGATTKKMSLMGEAVASGKVDHSTYSMFLDASSRQLRAKYPYFREEIDNIYQDLTGSVPANKVIADLFSQANKKDGAEAEYRHQLHEAQTNGTPEIAAIISAGRQPTYAELLKYNTAHMLTIAQTKQSTAQITLQDHFSKLEFQQNAKTARDIVFNGLDSQARGIMSTVPEDALNKHLAQTNKDIAEGKPPTTNPAFLTQAANQFEITANKAFNQAMYETMYTGKDGKQYTLRSILNDTDADNLRKEHKERMDQYLKPFRDGQTGMTALQGLWLKGTENQAVNELYKSEEWAAPMKAVEHVLGPQLTNSLFTSNSQGLKAAQKTITDHIVSKITQPTTLDDDLSKMKGLGSRAGMSDQELAKMNADVISRTVGLLNKPNLTPEAMKLVINKLYGGEVGSDWYSKAAPGDRDALYRRLTDPKITDIVYKQGSPEVQKQYGQWVEQASGARLMNGAADVKSTMVDMDTRHSIRFDRVNLQFQGVPRGRVNDNTSTDIAETQAEFKRDTIVRQLNATLSAWVPAAKAQGMDANEISAGVYKIFEMQGVELGSGTVKQDVRRLKSPQGPGLIPEPVRTPNLDIPTPEENFQAPPPPLAKPVGK